MTTAAIRRLLGHCATIDRNHADITHDGATFDATHFARRVKVEYIRTLQRVQKYTGRGSGVCILTGLRYFARSIMVAMVSPVQSTIAQEHALQNRRLV